MGRLQREERLQAEQSGASAHHPQGRPQGGVSGSMIRIGFCGQRATGNSNLAQHLRSVYEIPRYALATPIKRLTADAPPDQYERHLYLWNWAHILYPEASDALRAKFVAGVNAIFRAEQDRGRLAQQIGGLGRELDRDVWVRYLVDRLPAGDAVVEDVRSEEHTSELPSREKLVC